MAKSSVMFTFSPAPMSVRTAIAPSVVPGTLIITFGRSTIAQSRCASATVSFALFAEPGETSMETYPSPPFVASYTGMNRSQASRTSDVSTSSNNSIGERPAGAPRSWSS